MMPLRVFGLVSPEDQEWVVVPDRSARDLIRGLDGTPQLASWVPPEIHLLKSSDRKRLRHSDMPHYSSACLILRETAVDAVGDLLAADGELLPLACPDSPLWLFNCSRTIDAFDEDRSDVVRFPNSGKIMRIKTYAFRPEPLSDVSVFRIPQLPTSKLFVTERLVGRARIASLVRSEFEMLWEEPIE